MIRLDAATVLLQWSVGGLGFLWVTGRGRQVGVGYGWLLRGVYGLMATGALAVGHAFSIEPGIYLPGRWGTRLEDIVVAAEGGPDPMNRADHRLAVVDG